MNWLAVFLIGIFLQDIPYKPNVEYDIQLDYQFKTRPPVDHAKFAYGDSDEEVNRRKASTILPYLILNVKLVKLSDSETRVRIFDNFDKVVLSKKISEGISIPIDVGFTDDAKDRVTAHQYVMAFLSPDKKEVSRIVIHIQEDGTFMVNGEKRGKF
jgi:hypothetical protein